MQCVHKAATPHDVVPLLSLSCLSVVASPTPSLSSNVGVVCSPHLTMILLYTCILKLTFSGWFFHLDCDFDSILVTYSTPPLQAPPKLSLVWRHSLLQTGPSCTLSLPSICFIARWDVLFFWTLLISWGTDNYLSKHVKPSEWRNRIIDEMGLSERQVLQQQ